MNYCSFLKTSFIVHLYFFSGRSNVRYSIYSGDPDGLFRIDPITGAIKVSGNLDHESRASVLLNVQATSGNPPVYGHTQVLIKSQHNGS